MLSNRLIDTAMFRARARCALVRVSSVVKVLEQMTNNVVCGLRSLITTSRSCGSTFEMKCVLSSGDTLSRAPDHAWAKIDANTDINDVSKALAARASALTAVVADTAACMRFRVSLTSA